nr:Maff2 family protein [Mediterraneibacter faecis]
METYMAFFSSAIDTLQTLVIALGAGLGVWGVVNLLEGYGSDNPGSKSQGVKQFMAN